MPDYPKIRLATIAKLINQKVPGFRAEIVEGYCDTDRKIGRLRHPGKGRYGNRLVVRNKHDVVVIDHNAAETYRTNEEVLRKVERYWGKLWVDGAPLRKPPKGLPGSCGCCRNCLDGVSKCCAALDKE